MDSSLGVGIVGYGTAAKTFHVPLVSAEPRLKLKAIASSRPQVVEKEVPNVDAIAFEDVINRDDIDLVVIAGKNIDHVPQTLAALRSGKHVVVEKPMSLTLAEADEMLAAGNESQRHVFVFHNRKWDNGTLYLERLLRNETLGDIAVCDLHYNRFRPEIAARWREDGEIGGGMLYDLGPHLIFAALSLFGKPDWLFADVFAQRQGGVVDDYFHITLAYGHTRVQLRSSMLITANEVQIEAHGTKGSFVKYGTDPQSEMLKSGLLPSDDDWQRFTDDNYAIITDTDAKTHRVEIEAGTYDRFYAGVAACILDGEESPVPAKTARNVMALIEAGFTSAKEGRRVQLDGLL